MLITKIGTLPQGIDIDGVIYRDYNLREQIVADEVEVMESADAARAAKNDGFFNVCILARRLRLPGLDREVTPAMVMSMPVGDFNYLLALDKEASAQRATFRKEGQPSSAVAPDAAQAGV